jgi:NADH-quinone oxidoreductase subunit H
MVVIALILGALLTSLLERKFYRPDDEQGAAANAKINQELELLHVDRWLFLAGPITALFGVALAIAVIPFSPDLIGIDLGIGVFYFIVVIDFVVLGIALTGWGANTENAIESCYRIVAQLVAYVVPLGLAYVGAIMMARSLSTIDIVNAQTSWWFIWLQPIGFALYIVTGLMQSYRAPFAEPFSSKINHGILSVSGGWMALTWRIALSGVLFAIAAMGVILYLGGWHGPWLPAPVWFLLKTYGLMALLVWLGTRVKPFSTARMLKLAWRTLIPLGMINVLVIGGLILLGVGPK